MDWQHHGRGPNFRGGPRGIFWLLPLLVGIGIGAIFFGGLRGPWHDYGDRHGRGFERDFMPDLAAPAAPAAPAASAGPRVENMNPGPVFRGDHHDWHPFGPQGHGGPFGHFVGFRLLVPLALIGAGLWLLSGRRRGSGPWNGPTGPQSSYTAPPASPQPSASQPPATGETRIL